MKHLEVPGMWVALGLAMLSGIGAPWLLGRSRSLGGLWLAAVPSGLFLYFVTRLPVVMRDVVVRESIDWIPPLGARLSLSLDGLSSLFCLIISGVGGVVVIYALGYLGAHPQRVRFFFFLSSFMVSMLGVVLADNLIALFLFWELTSYSSYLLIGFHHASDQARRAAWQALIVTAGGGLALLAGIVAIGQAAGSYEITELLAAGTGWHDHPVYHWAVGLVLLGALTKSAQFPFHFWLPDAMQAPAPVSAYLHSATMVKAGVYLLARLSPILGGSALWGTLLLTAGAATMLVSAYLLLDQTAIKRLLAYSTTWALGLMVMLLGVGSHAAVEAAMVWILAHAAYKATLFLIAGNLEQGAGAKDIKVVGGLRRCMPFTALAAAMGLASMAGLPPALGFVAKELLYEALLHAEHTPPWLVGIAVATTAAIMFAALKLGIGPFLGKRVSPRPAKEVPFSMWSGPLVLGALGFGLVFAAAWIGPGLLGPAARRVVRAPVEIDLGLWHGLGLPLLFSGTSLLFGGIAYLKRHRFERLQRINGVLAKVGPQRAYVAGIGAVLWLARWQFSVVQSGLLRRYVMTVLAAVLAVVGYAAWQHATEVVFTAADPPQYQVVALILIIMVAAVGIAFTYTRLTVVALLGVIGYSVALLFLRLGAPDLALTQVIVETMMLILLVLAFHRLPQLARLSRPVSRARDALWSALAGALMAVLVLATLQVSTASELARYFGARSLDAAHGRNVVNVILVDFRALDTLGEITVLGVAAIGVLALVRKHP